jgi:hypothetical protein
MDRPKPVEPAQGASKPLSWSTIIVWVIVWIVGFVCASMLVHVGDEVNRGQAASLNPKGYIGVGATLIVLFLVSFGLSVAYFHYNGRRRPSKVLKDSYAAWKDDKKKPSSSEIEMQTMLGTDPFNLGGSSFNLKAPRVGTDSFNLGGSSFNLNAPLYTDALSLY